MSNDYHRRSNHYHASSSSHHHRSTNSSFTKHNRSYYSSPLEKLEKLTKKFTPKRVLENDKYNKLCQNGECDLFEIPSSSYRYYYIHRATSMDILNDLIDYASQTTHYTIDTEDQMQSPPHRSLAALIQIEFTYLNGPSIIILIETLHLPPENSQTFNKIKQLCKIIFSEGHHVYSWGELEDEMGKFCKFNLFDIDDINQVTPNNTQKGFKKWYNENYPTSIYLKENDNDKYSLQLAIYLTFNEWLNKRMTLANWGCGIDMKLETFTPKHPIQHNQHQIIEDEKYVRELMTIYAMNDCFSVTKLAQHIESSEKSTQPPTIQYNDISEQNDEQIIINDNEQSINLCPLNDDSEDKGVHVQYELPMSNDLNEVNRITPEPSNEVHGQYELTNEIEMISDDDEHQELNDNERPHKMQHETLTRTQRKNLFEISRLCFFNILRNVSTVCSATSHGCSTTSNTDLTISD
ncbi:unnamed protein product [Rotaria sp. Silwood2]|nr:unnamed protein product [Rotaria sp. Silwood2]CAF4419899.1 unnamed protein product [Rotaria sp. Silwood2]